MAWNRADFEGKLRMGPFKTVAAIVLSVMETSGDTKVNPFQRITLNRVDIGVDRVWFRFRARAQR